MEYRESRNTIIDKLLVCTDCPDQLLYHGVEPRHLTNLSYFISDFQLKWKGETLKSTMCVFSKQSILRNSNQKWFQDRLTFPPVTPMLC